MTGAYYNGAGPAASQHVTIDKNKSGKPSKVVAEAPAVTGVDNSLGSFVMTLGSAVSLKPGTYWVSVQVNMDFALGGQWGEARTGTHGGPAQWPNPGDGFGTGCTRWGAENDCIPNGLGDKMFTVKGKAKPI